MFRNNLVPLLATPLFVGFVKPDSPAAVLKEGRLLAQAPKFLPIATIGSRFRKKLTPTSMTISGSGT